MRHCPQGECTEKVPLTPAKAEDIVTAVTNVQIPVGAER